MQQRKKLKKLKLQQDQPILFYFPENSEHYKKRRRTRARARSSSSSSVAVVVLESELAATAHPDTRETERARKPRKTTTVPSTLRNR